MPARGSLSGSRTLFVLPACLALMAFGCGGSQSHRPSQYVLTSILPVPDEACVDEFGVADDSLLFQYLGSNYGASAGFRIYCGNQHDATPTTIARSEVPSGPCPSTKCSRVAAPKNLPIEPAILSAVVQESKQHEVKLSSSSGVERSEAGGRTFEAHDATQSQVVRFHLGEETLCISRLQLHEHREDYDLATGVSPGSTAASPGASAPPRLEFGEMQVGQVYMEQRRTENGYTLLLLEDTEVDGPYGGMLAREQTMCLNPDTPIRLLESTHFGARLTDGRQGPEVLVFALKPQPKKAASRATSAPVEKATP